MKRDIVDFVKMKNKVAKVDILLKRLFREFVLELQESWMIPGTVNYKLLSLGCPCIFYQEN